MGLLMSSDGTVAPAPAAVDAGTVIDVRGVGKCYQLYDKPVHRMWQSLFGSRHQFYREFWALRDVSFALRRGETLGIVGRNGAGKSTLLQLVAGTLKPTEGTVAQHGRVAALLELGSGFNPEFTGRQNVYLNASILGLRRDEIEARIDGILAYADIGDFVDQPVRNYSTGMVMRLAFAVIVHVDADVLIIDEALAVGDAFFMQKCMRYMNEFRKRGSMLFVSHDASAVASLCDRAIWLDHGRVQQAGAVRPVLEAYLEAAPEMQRGAVKRRVAPAAPMSRPTERVAARTALLDRSTLRNDLHVAPFRPDTAGVGALGAQITHTGFYNDAGEMLTMVVGGECVTLRIEVRARQALANVVVGFYVKDRRGQFLFGDNTLAIETTVGPAADGDVLVASFRFTMPRLLPGEYFVTAGVAEGTADSHVVQYWLNEALLFSAEGGTLATGLIGLPMLDIQLEHR